MKVNTKFIIIITTILFVGLFISGSERLFADEVTDLQSQIDQTKAEISEKNHDIAELVQEINKIQDSNASISQKLSRAKQKRDELQKKSKNLEIDIDTLTRELTDLSAEIDNRQQLIINRVANMYKVSKFPFLVTVLETKSITKMLKLLIYHRIILQKQLKEFENLAVQKDIVNDDLEQAMADKKSLDKELTKADMLVKSLQDQQSAYLYSLRISRQKQASLQREVIALNSSLSSLSKALQSAIMAKAGGQGGSDTGGGNNSGGGNTTNPSSHGKYDIYIDNNKVASDVQGIVRVKSASIHDILEINGYKKYRGIIEMRSDSNVFAINELAFEDYIKGIGEMSSSWPIEALKSQAVAVRTYAVANWNKRSNYHYNLREDTFDQNYVGYSKEISSGGAWVNAVVATTNQILTSGGRVIAAYYHSTCGGHTLSSAEVWGGHRSYAQAVSDWYQDGGVWKSYDASSPWSYKKWGRGSINDSAMVDLINATIYLSEDPNSSARQNNIRRSDFGGFTEEQLLSALHGTDFISKYGNLQSVESVYNNGKTAIDQNARLTTRLKVVGDKGTLYLDANVFWVVFNSRSPGTLTLVYSKFWTVVKEGNSWNFYSRGYPHRVGLCQYGARGRANAGQNYRTILSHYYQNTAISNVSKGNIRIGLTRLGSGDITIQNVTGGGLTVTTFTGLSFGAGNSVRVVKK